MNVIEITNRKISDTKMLIFNAKGINTIEKKIRLSFILLEKI